MSETVGLGWGGAQWANKEKLARATLALLRQIGSAYESN